MISKCRGTTVQHDIFVNRDKNNLKICKKIEKIDRNNSIGVYVRGG
jgi:hypothetical protein